MALDCIPKMGLTVSPVTPLSSCASFPPAPGRAQGAGYSLRDLEPKHWRALPRGQAGSGNEGSRLGGTMRTWRATVSPS